MGLCPPMSYQDVWAAVVQCDYSGDGRINRMEMFMLFKRLQGINAGMTFNLGWGGMGGGMMGPGMMGPGMGMGGGMMGPGMMGPGMGMGGGMWGGW